MTWTIWFCKWHFYTLFFWAILWSNIRACLLGLSSWQDVLLLFRPHYSDVPRARKRCCEGLGTHCLLTSSHHPPLWCCKPAKKFHNISLNLIQVIMFRSKRLVYISLASPASVFGVLSRNPLSDLILCLSGAIVWGTCNQWLNGLAAECKNKQQIWVPGTRRSRGGGELEMEIITSQSGLMIWMSICLRIQEISH